MRTPLFRTRFHTILHTIVYTPSTQYTHTVHTRCGLLYHCQLPPPPPPLPLPPCQRAVTTNNTWSMVRAAQKKQGYTYARTLARMRIRMTKLTCTRMRTGAQILSLTVHVEIRSVSLTIMHMTPHVLYRIGPSYSRPMPSMASVAREERKTHSTQRTADMRLGWHTVVHHSTL